MQYVFIIHIYALEKIKEKFFLSPAVVACLVKIGEKLGKRSFSLPLSLRRKKVNKLHLTNYYENDFSIFTKKIKYFFNNIFAYISPFL